MPLCMPLGPLWQSCHALITYRSICKVFVAMTDHVTHVTHGTTSHVRPGHTMDGHDMSNQTCMTNV